MLFRITASCRSWIWQFSAQNYRRNIYAREHLFAMIAVGRRLSESDSFNYEKLPSIKVLSPSVLVNILIQKRSTEHWLLVLPNKKRMKSDNTTTRHFALFSYVKYAKQLPAWISPANFIADAVKFVQEAGEWCCNKLAADAVAAAKCHSVAHYRRRCCVASVCWLVIAKVHLASRWTKTQCMCSCACVFRVYVWIFVFISNAKGIFPFIQFYLHARTDSIPFYGSQKKHHFAFTFKNDI